MKTNDFRSWLSKAYRTRRGYSLGMRTIDSRIANCVTVEDAEGNLDTHFDRDQMNELIRRLTYSRSDELKEVPPLHGIAIHGDVYEGTATLKSAALLYRKFRMSLVDVLMNSRNRATVQSTDRSRLFPDALLTEFFRQASFYRYHEKFDDDERLYKIQLANDFAKSRQLLQSDPARALKLFLQALKSKNNNIIDWRDRGPIRAWIKNSPQTFVDCLENLWNEAIDLEKRFSFFCGALSKNGVTQTGGQLAITSTLLMT